MKRTLTLISIFLILSTALLAGGDKHKKKKVCSRTAEECATSFRTYAESSWDGINVKGIGEQEVVVTAVADESPGAVAGIQVGDVLVAMDKTALAGLSKKEFHASMVAVAVGQQVTYKIKRGESYSKIPVTMAQVPMKKVATKLGYHMLKQHTIKEVTTASL